MRRPCTIKVCLVLMAMAAVGGSQAAAQWSGRLEFGLGAGVGGVAPGLGIRLGVGATVRRWGGLLRLSVHEGETLGYALGYPVQEVVGDLGFLVTRGLLGHSPERLLLGAGIGRTRAKAVDDATGRLEELPWIWGVPFELTWYLGDGRGLGGSLSTQGNINPDFPFVCLMLSVTVAIGSNPSGLR